MLMLSRPSETTRRQSREFPTATDLPLPGEAFRVVAYFFHFAYAAYCWELTMRLVSGRLIRGPNIWSSEPLFDALIDIGDGLSLANNSTRYRRLSEALAETTGLLAANRPKPRHCDAASRGDVVADSLIELVASSIADAIVSLLRAGGAKADFAVAEVVDRRRIRLLVECAEAEQTRETMLHFLDRCQTFLTSACNERAGEPLRLHFAPRFPISPNTTAIVAAARALGVPTLPFEECGFVQLGHGACQKRVCGAMTNLTSAVAVELSQNKEWTKRLLRRWSLPRPEGRVVRDPDAAWQAARELGPPVVVKPLAADYGNGVSLNLSTESSIREACLLALEEGDDVIVEKHFQGNDYRLLVVGDRIVAAAMRRAPTVIGDGRRSIAALVEEANASAERTDHPNNPLEPIRLDSQADAWLTSIGWSRGDVPASGESVQVRGNTHLKTGGSNHDMTRSVHPSIARRIVDAVRLVGLDVAGVDLVAEDIARPVKRQRLAIVEINALPGMVQHMPPMSPKMQPVGEAIVRMLFPNSAQSRIPLVATLRSQGSAEIARATAALLRRLGWRIGLASSQGLHSGDHWLSRHDHANAEGAEAILLHSAIDAAVFELSNQSVIDDGLAFSRAGTVMLSDVEPRSGSGRAAEELLAKCAKFGGSLLLTDFASPDRLRRWTDWAPGQVIVVSADPASDFVRGHRLRGGRAVVGDGANVLFATGGHVEELTTNFASDTTRPPRRRMARLLALAAAWTLGLNVQRLATGRCRAGRRAQRQVIAVVAGPASKLARASDS